MAISTKPLDLRNYLCKLPHVHDYVWKSTSALELCRELSSHFTLHDIDPGNPIIPQSLLFQDSANKSHARSSSAPVLEPEYTPLGQGKPCGHVFQAGESTYACKTCATDETCVLCARCFAESDHEGHNVTFYQSKGNSGCCDCGDLEAWKRDVFCSMHNPPPTTDSTQTEQKEDASLTKEAEDIKRKTVGIVLDYICDVFSCAPEDLREAKSFESICIDEVNSRLKDDKEKEIKPALYDLILWNDEKHTINEVQEQIARHCRTSKSYGIQQAAKIDSVGRTVVKKGGDIRVLLSIGELIEKHKLSVTIRPARDTFREEMCFVMLEWLHTALGMTSKAVNRLICLEFFQEWNEGTLTSFRSGRQNIYDHEIEQQQFDKESAGLRSRRVLREMTLRMNEVIGNEDEFDILGEENVDMPDADTFDAIVQSAAANQDINSNRSADVAMEDVQDKSLTKLSGSEMKTHWKTKVSSTPTAQAEDMNSRLRVDWLIMYDIRMWKIMRDALRSLFTSIITVDSDFKRYLGLCFAKSYVNLAQLYLVGDREPDHSIVNFSVQLFTTPSITIEVIKRADFLTNLFAILYTFLTTRNAAGPREAMKSQTFDNAAINNRRIFHYFKDAEYILSTPFMREQLRHDSRYCRQFLDLLSLCQGLHPHVRAIDDHVEYEQDLWTNAAIAARELDKLAKSVVESFFMADLHQLADVIKAMGEAIHPASTFVRIHEKARAINDDESSTASIETKEIKVMNGETYQVPSARVIKSSMSFHHPIHRFISWMIQASENMTIDDIRSLLDEQLWADIFDVPLKMLAWASQIRVGLWVRNGVTLVHQYQTYKSPMQRDYQYHRDIFMIQAGLTFLGERFFVQMVDKYDLTSWLEGSNEQVSEQWLDEYEPNQRLSIMDDFIHLLVVVLTERDDLMPGKHESKLSTRAIQREIAHVLCFKPMSFNDLCPRLTSRVVEAADFEEILKEMTVYKTPERLYDTGLYELKSEYIANIDPMYAYYHKNQREEADDIYRTYQAKHNGIAKTDVVPLPSLLNIQSGLFQNYASFIRFPSFCRIIYNYLEYLNTREDKARTEPMLQVLLHLILLVLEEDITSKVRPNFVDQSLRLFPLLRTTMQHEAYAQCLPRAKLIVEKAKLLTDLADFDLETPIPKAEIDLEMKKKQAKSRQAKVMAQFKAQQDSFMSNQGIDWNQVDTTDINDDSQPNVREYPSDACILCQEEADDNKVFGCFAFVGPSNIKRSTRVDDVDHVREVLETPTNLDRQYDPRPFGMASNNKVDVSKIDSSGQVILLHRNTLARGFDDHDHVQFTHVFNSCGHLMHLTCYEAFVAATARRQGYYISRNHPENTAKKEFLCPLCKAVGNMFLPIVFNARVESYPGMLDTTTQKWDSWVGSLYDNAVYNDNSPKVGNQSLKPWVIPAINSYSEDAETSNPQSDELKRAYKYMNESIKANMLGENILSGLADTITALEIQQRGVYSQGTLLSTISDQAMTLLRICSATIAPSKLCDFSSLLTLQSVSVDFFEEFPFDLDCFHTLVDMAYAKIDWSVNGLQLIRMTLLAQLCKTVHTYRQYSSKDPRVMSFRKAALCCLDLGDLKADENSSLSLQHILSSQALIFLRKVMILVHVRSSIDFTAVSENLDPSLPEVDRLCILLKLPSLDKMYQSFISDTSDLTAESHMIRTWSDRDSFIKEPEYRIAHPAIFELVGLPDTFDVLVELAAKAKCPTDPEKHVSDPMLCLFCGKIFCCQVSCCGAGANKHMKMCGGSIGLFLSISKCVILYLHDNKGSFGVAPYLDKHGQPDMCMRKSNMLYLNQKRYDKMLRDLWLSHGIPSVIARKLDGDMNHGGWDTL